MCWSLHVEFTNGSIVNVKFDNMIEMQAMFRGIEIVNRETNAVARVWIDGEKRYE